MKGGVDQERGEGQGDRRGSPPSFSFWPPFLDLFHHFPKSTFCFISNSSSALLFKFEHIFLLATNPKWISGSFHFSLSGYNM